MLTLAIKKQPSKFITRSLLVYAQPPEKGGYRVGERAKHLR